MSEAKARILRRLRAGCAVGTESPLEVPTRRFDWTLDERLDRFCERMRALRGEVYRVGADWPEMLPRLLREHGVGRLLYGAHGPWGARLERDWTDRSGIALTPCPDSLDNERASLFDAHVAGFTSARAAIAETGSLVLWPDVEEPRLLSLVPPVHVVLLEASSIRSTLAELIAEQGWCRGLPTNVVLISGPSKSADIEQTLAYGVHGPKTLIVLVCEVSMGEG